MSVMKFRRFAMALALAPLALGLAACSKTEESTGGLSGAPIAKVAAPAGKSWNDVVTVTPEGGYRVGNPEAPLKLVEYGALSCSHCAEFAEASSAELRDNFVASGRVSYELNFFMLNFLDVPATLLATCSAPEAVVPLSEQFWGWQSQMFANLQAAGQAQLEAAGNLPPEQRFAAIAQLAGMDQFFASRGVALPQGKACLANAAKATQLVTATEKAGKDLGITGTPTFFLNGSKLSGNTWAVIKADLEKAGAR